MPQIYDMGPTALLPLRRKACWGFFRPKNPTASAGFEPANLGTKGHHRSCAIRFNIQKFYFLAHTVYVFRVDLRTNSYCFSNFILMHPLTFFCIINKRKYYNYLVWNENIPSNNKLKCHITQRYIFRFAQTFIRRFFVQQFKKKKMWQIFFCLRLFLYTA